MTIAFETSVHATGSGASQALPGLTTTKTNCIIVVVSEINSQFITSISDAAGLTWQSRAITGTGTDLEMWWAKSAATLSSNVITVNMTGGGFNAIDAFAVSGAGFAVSPWDANGSLPVKSNANSTVTISTVASRAMVIGAYRFQNQSAPSQGAGFTLISGADFLLTQYQIVSLPQTNLNVVTGSGGFIINGAIGDALIEEVYFPPYPTRTMAQLRM